MFTGGHPSGKQASIPSSLATAALKNALRATLFTSVLALAAGLVRILPWLLDPSVTWRIAMPFARSVAVLALESSLAVGWPIGWALSAVAFSESGEWRVLALLGERPARTVSRLGGQTVLFGLAVAAVSFASGRQSTEPGRVVGDLIADGRAACLLATEPRTYTVPFLGATWLCNPDRAPRLVGQGPGPLASLTFSARDVRVSGDLGSFELDDAHLAVANPRASLHVDSLRIQGTAPWGHASAVPPLVRAITLAVAVMVSALAAVAILLSGRAHSRLAALLVGAAGPIAALAALRAAERLGGTESWGIALVPLVSLAAPLVLAWGGARLPGLWHAASRYRV